MNVYEGKTRAGAQYSYDRDTWTLTVYFPGGTYEYYDLSPFHLDHWLSFRNLGRASNWLTKNFRWRKLEETVGTDSPPLEEKMDIETRFAASKELSARLRAIGGKRAGVDMDDPDLEAILKKGREFGRTKAVIRGEGNRPNRCHQNTSQMYWRTKAGGWDGPAYLPATGYALGDDGIWRQHSWLVDERGDPVDTTFRWDAYFGVVFKGGAADRWAKKNLREALKEGLAEGASPARKIAALQAEMTPFRMKKRKNQETGAVERYRVYEKPWGSPDPFEGFPEYKVRDRYSKQDWREEKPPRGSNKLPSGWKLKRWSYWYTEGFGVEPRVEAQALLLTYGGEPVLTLRTDGRTPRDLGIVKGGKVYDYFNNYDSVSEFVETLVEVLEELEEQGYEDS